MVIGYMCEDHGLQDECDVSDAGARICQECEKEMTGLTGITRGRRAPPSDEPGKQSGNIRWTVVTGHSGDGFTVDAFDFRDAAEKGIEKVDNPQGIKEVRPRKLDYR